MAEELPTTVLGIDPGVTTGLCMLAILNRRITSVTRGADLEPVGALIPWADYVAIERVVLGNATIRRTRGGTVEALTRAEGWAKVARDNGRPLQYMAAGNVKPWASDAQLRAWGLYDVTAGRGGHDRDAARHALYMAVRRGLLPPTPPPRGVALHS